MRIWVAVAVISVASLAHADPAADAAKAFQGFADAVAAKKLPAELDAFKKIFQHWKVDLRAPTDGHIRAGIAPGRDLAWVATEISSNVQCTAYRALFVLQPEKGAWKIVHQHFSSGVLAP